MAEQDTQREGGARQRRFGQGRQRGGQAESAPLFPGFQMNREELQFLQRELASQVRPIKRIGMRRAWSQLGSAGRQAFIKEWGGMNAESKRAAVQNLLNNRPKLLQGLFGKVRQAMENTPPEVRKTGLQLISSAIAASQAIDPDKASKDLEQLQTASKPLRENEGKDATLMDYNNLRKVFEQSEFSKPPATTFAKDTANFAEAALQALPEDLRTGTESIGASVASTRELIGAYESYRDASAGFDLKDPQNNKAVRGTQLALAWRKLDADLQKVDLEKIAENNPRIAEVLNTARQVLPLFQGLGR